MAYKKKEDADLILSRDEALKEEVRKEEKAKRKAIVDQVLRILGLVMATMIFLISFSMFAPLTIFGWIFNNGIDPRIAWRAMDTQDNIFRFGGDSLYAILTGGDPTIAVWLASAIQIALGTLLAVLISIYVKDVIGVVKNFLGIGKNIVVDTAEGVKEGAEELLGFNKGKKTLFSEPEVQTKKSGPVKKEAPVKAVKPKDPIEQLTPEQADLVLAGKAKVSDFVVKEETVVESSESNTSETKPAQAEVNPRKSLFDNRR
jgi:hypothetical protein